MADEPTYETRASVASVFGRDILHGNTYLLTYLLHGAESFLRS